MANSISSFNYWADVTSIVKPIVDAAPAGIIDLTIGEPLAYSYYIDGESLIVIFDDPNQVNDNTVILTFGAQNTLGDNFAVGLAQPVDKSLPGFALDMSLGISFGYQGTGQYSQVDVNSNRLTTSAGGQDDGDDADGALLTTGGIGDSNSNPADPNALPLDYNSDDELYDLIPFVNNGDTNIDVYTLNPSNDDNIYFAGFFLGSTTAIIGEGILLGPSSAINLLGTNHTVTATVQDNLGNPIAGVNVTLDIISGPNAGLSGSGITDSEGKVYFTYSGSIVGTDVLRASFYNSEQKLITSNTVTKEWANQEKQEQTVVNGHIYAADGITPVSGTGVSVTCDGLGPLVDTTDSEGYYMVEFLEGCDLGDTVEVTSGGVSDTDTVANAVIWKNLVYVNLTVPEFGVITALAALAGSVLVFTVIRKRK